MEAQYFADTNLYYDDSFNLAQEELEITTSGNNDSVDSNHSTASPNSQDNFSDSNSWSQSDFFDFNLLPINQTENVPLDDCFIDILENDNFLTEFLDELQNDEPNQNANSEIDPSNMIPEMVDLNPNQFFHRSENQTISPDQLAINGDFSIEIDEDDDDDDMSSIEHCYTPDSNDYQVNSRKFSLVSRPAKKYRNKSCRSLPYTIHDLPHSQSLNINNEDIAEGKPGERIILSEEEISFFRQEGLAVPTHLPLTKEELRALKTIRRKIRNKISAKHSRAKKQDYISGLEKRVTVCNQENIQLKKKVKVLESDNKSLLSQVRHLRELLSQYAPQQKLGDSSKPSLCLCMLTFLMLFVPYLMPGLMPPISSPDMSPLSSAVAKPSPASRRLLHESDLSQQLGNPYDVTVRPSPAWKYPPQSPVLSPLPKDDSEVVKEMMDVNSTKENLHYRSQESASPMGNSGKASINSSVNINAKDYEEASLTNDKALWHATVVEKI